MRHKEAVKHGRVIGVSISDEKPLHMRLRKAVIDDLMMQEFQSQTRSRSTCDQVMNFEIKRQLGGFNLRREAAPHATVSILAARARMDGFNLRREAAPHATCHWEVYVVSLLRFQSQTRSRSTCDINLPPEHQTGDEFQSQTRSRSTCDYATAWDNGDYDAFQSQTRSRSTCDSS